MILTFMQAVLKKRLFVNEGTNSCANRSFCDETSASVCFRLLHLETEVYPKGRCKMMRKKDANAGELSSVFTQQNRHATRIVMEEMMGEELSSFLGAKWGECTC